MKKSLLLLIAFCTCVSSMVWAGPHHENRHHQYRRHEIYRGHPYQVRHDYRRSRYGYRPVHRNSGPRIKIGSHGIRIRA